MGVLTIVFRLGLLAILIRIAMEGIYGPAVVVGGLVALISLRDLLRARPEIGLSPARILRR